MYRVLSIAAAAACLILAQPASAATVMFQGLGLFASNAPTTEFSAANTSFSFSFDMQTPFEGIPTGPTLYTYDWSNFTYSLGDVEAAPASLDAIGYESDGFTLVFTDRTRIKFVGADLGSDGLVYSPTWGLYSVYVSVPSSGPVASRAAGSGPAAAALPDPVGYAMVVTTGSAIAAVPEPAGWGLMITGFAAAGAMLRQRRRLAAAGAVA